MKKILKFSFLPILILTMLLQFAAFAESEPVNPNTLTDNNTQTEGTVTISITVPDNIDNAVDVVLCSESGNEYFLTAYKDNNYTAYANIPQGTYTVCSAGIRDDYKGEYPAKWDTDQIIIDPSGAVKINVTISDKQDLSNPDTYKSTNIDGNNADTINGTGSSLTSPSPTPMGDDTTSAVIGGVNYKSLIISTVLTILCLAVLLLCYKLIVWSKEYKNNRKDDEE